MSSSYSPPVSSDHVLFVSSLVLIDAPIEKVWGVLMDLPAYREWSNILGDQTLAEGKNIHITINTALTLSEPGVLDGGSAFAVVSTFDPENYRYLLNTERWQILSVDEATGKTKYETHEFFDGILRIIKIAKGFQAAADTLKERVEGMK
ncbi:hypothetical protein CPB84DRAFT_1765153 [Gymnopilus junonius]|uniref:SRPBCC domain-containing protein n=1 Tax=Gymnopilus junonius TaxID=109634 RepID=A0A9P5TTH2_GYMJU|nr:hypothetical protein CPB84DRAFT_1765153 [Gymnopilus junonius]